jgi:hypothetical protein
VPAVCQREGRGRGFKFESAFISWPDAGGIIELSALILQEPPPPHALWEAATLVLSNMLRFSS